mmetsp:Transcript_21309/g.24378  ORF Transcript_21309/g.24378 Transcript_21309/m.24378 type:complete len:269 (+) Transcript_21309:1651-2457(+)
MMRVGGLNGVPPKKGRTIDGSLIGNPITIIGSSRGGSSIRILFLVIVVPSRGRILLFVRNPTWRTVVDEGVPGVTVRILAVLRWMIIVVRVTVVVVAPPRRVVATEMSLVVVVVAVTAAMTVAEMVVVAMIIDGVIVVMVEEEKVRVVEEICRHRRLVTATNPPKIIMVMTIAIAIDVVVGVVVITVVVVVPRRLATATRTVTMMMIVGTVMNNNSINIAVKDDIIQISERWLLHDIIVKVKEKKKVVFKIRTRRKIISLYALKKEKE